MNLNIRFVFLSKVQSSLYSPQAGARIPTNTVGGRNRVMEDTGGAQKQCQGACTLHAAQGTGPVTLWSTKPQLRLIIVEFA